MNARILLSVVTTFVLLSIAGAALVRIHGVNYNPRREAGVCATYENIQEDLTLLSQITSRLKIYSSVDCNQGQHILQALNNVDMTVTLGIWIDQWHESEYPNEIDELRRLATTIGLHKVDAIVVGSETQYRGDEMTVETLLGYIRDVERVVTELGYPNIPVTTADVVYNLQSLPQLTQELDLIMENQFPFWEELHIDSATDKLFQEYQTLQQITGKKVVVGETGWPSGGEIVGAAQPSVENYNRYLQEVVCRANAVGMQYFWFEAFDAGWKRDDPQEEEVEQYWGLFTADRRIKAGLNLFITCPEFPTTGTQSTTAAPSSTTDAASTTSDPVSTSSTTNEQSGTLGDPFIPPAGSSAGSAEHAKFYLISCIVFMLFVILH